MSFKKGRQARQYTNIRNGYRSVLLPKLSQSYEPKSQPKLGHQINGCIVVSSATNLDTVEKMEQSF